MTVPPISPDGPIRLAISMDDLFLWPDMPVAPGYTHLSITRAMTDAMRQHGVRGAYAFSATTPLEQRPELARVFDHWVEAGHHIANHTHHHANLNWVTVPKYLADIERTETLIQPWSNRAPTRYFRYCMDNWGNTPEKHAGVQAYLARNGFTPAPISIWFYDTEFLAPHWRALQSGDAEGVLHLRRAFVDTAERQLRVQAAAARAMFGRDPAHIWLIHGTPLAADCLDAILDRFQAAGVQFISLEEAMADPMNAEAVPLVTPRFLNQVQKWAEVKGVGIEDCPPAILHEIDRIAPMPGQSTPEVMGRVFRAISDSMGGEFFAKIY
jgi:peptidoglycan/xylan/chitin deacetylase (PgdA/CDA1 family)